MSLNWITWVLNGHSNIWTITSTNQNCSAPQNSPKNPSEPETAGRGMWFYSLSIKAVHVENPHLLDDGALAWFSCTYRRVDGQTGQSSISWWFSNHRSSCVSSSSSHVWLNPNKSLWKETEDDLVDTCQTQGPVGHLWPTLWLFLALEIVPGPLVCSAHTTDTKNTRLHWIG